MIRRINQRFTGKKRGLRKYFYNLSKKILDNIPILCYWPPPKKKKPSLHNIFNSRLFNFFKKKHYLHYVFFIKISREGRGSSGPTVVKGQLLKIGQSILWILNWRFDYGHFEEVKCQRREENKNHGLFPGMKE